MIKLKTPYEIDLIRIACHRLAGWMAACIEDLRAGNTYDSGISIAEDLEEYVKGFPGTASDWGLPFYGQQSMHRHEFGYPICVSVNDEIVHSRPMPIPFDRDDVITIDAGLSYKGYCADMARTVIYGEGPQPGCNQHSMLADRCRLALYQAEAACKPGNTIGDISEAISSAATNIAPQLGVVVDYTGHGIGKKLHEEPRICNAPGIFPKYDEIVLRPGMVICLEPMFTLGKGQTVLAGDGWKVWTQDGSIAAHFEDEILITEDGCEVLTRLPGEYPEEEQ
jgi:methionyl aminopeptidase